MSKKLKCKLCGWETLRWSRRKGVLHPSDGFNRLREHYFLHHDNYLKEIEEYAGLTEESSDGK